MNRQPAQLKTKFLYIRKLAPGDKYRPVEWVALEELAAAAEWLLEEEIGMPRESLVRQTSHIMGYDRTGAHVQKRVNSAIDLLLRSGRVFESNNQIKLTKNE